MLRRADLGDPVVVQALRSGYAKEKVMLRALRSPAGAVATADLLAALRRLPPGPERDRPAEEAFVAVVAAAVG